mmetsp:Transcript_17103/g.46368  ORF Transcript_17103/g.46368 Transcript_17103/m.46368 type:complete len:107 (-) Transcript_17103:82-402(-)
MPLHPYPVSTQTSYIRYLSFPTAVWSWTSPRRRTPHNSSQRWLTAARRLMCRFSSFSPANATPKISRAKGKAKRAEDMQVQERSAWTSCAVQPGSHRRAPRLVVSP